MQSSQFKNTTWHATSNSGEYTSNIGIPQYSGEKVKNLIPDTIPNTNALFISPQLLTGYNRVSTKLYYTGIADNYSGYTYQPVSPQLQTAVPATFIGNGNFNVNNYTAVPNPLGKTLYKIKTLLDKKYNGG